MIAFKLLFAIAAIYFVYLAASTFNQKIFSYPYPRLKGKKQEYFEYADLLQMISTFFSAVTAFIISKIIIKERAPKIPLLQKAILGLLYTNYVSCSNYALKYVPYSIRIFWDKMGYLMTIIVSLFWSRYTEKAKFHLRQKQLKRAIIISAGALIFSYFYIVQHDTVSKKFNKKQMKIGYILIAISIFSKGFFVDSQSFCKNAYKITQFQLMYTVNFASFIISLLALVLKQQLYLAYNFCLQHREIFMDILQFSLLSVLGQLLIYYVGCNFNLQQNMLPLISMTRKLLSMLLKLIISRRSLNVGMAIGLILVFGSTIYQLVDQTFYLLTKTKPLKVKLKIENKSSIQNLENSGEMSLPSCGE